MKPIRRRLRRAAYHAGALRLLRKRLRGALTVVMFHRVVDRTDPDFGAADPEYTIEAGLFDELLGFFCDHYAVVGLADLFAAAEHARPLPEHALLISFDDGWADNLRYAVPLLRSRGLPAVIFVAAEPILSAAATWWQQQVFDAGRRGDLQAVLDRTGIRGTILEVVCQLGTLTESARAEIIAPLSAPTPATRMMLMPGDLRRLTELGIAIGIHGYTHLPLTRVVDLDRELRDAQSVIASLSGDGTSAAALACPHGRYDRRVLEAARQRGFRLVFTSDRIVNRTSSGMVAAEHPLGRVDVDAPQITDAAGRFDPSAAAAWLWRRPLGVAGPT
jgi:peptidoglycan/xylan/chitin deacetylase (PgdA/CDA1 family)